MKVRFDRALAKDCTLAFARLALGAGFLSAVADRFGFWGPYGKRGVAWGDFDHFLVYTHHLTSVFSVRVSDALGVVATSAEIVFGFLLLLGLRIRLISLLSGLLLLSFGAAMAAATGPKSPLDASVFSAAAAALVISFHDADRFTLDASRSVRWTNRRR